MIEAALAAPEFVFSSKAVGGDKVYIFLVLKSMDAKGRTGTKSLKIIWYNILNEFL